MHYLKVKLLLTTTEGCSKSRNLFSLGQAVSVLRRHDLVSALVHLELDVQHRWHDMGPLHEVAEQLVDDGDGVEAVGRNLTLDGVQVLLAVAQGAGGLLGEEVGHHGEEHEEEQAARYALVLQHVQVARQVPEKKKNNAYRICLCVNCLLWGKSDSMKLDK